MILNRLGQPTIVGGSSSAGARCFIYDAGTWTGDRVTHYGSNREVESSTGNVTTYTTDSAHHKPVDYTPYRFAIFFDATDCVASVQDLLMNPVLPSASPRTTSSREATAAAAPTDAGSAGQVWVNTKSGTIWNPGSRYFGKTKEGRYMSAQEALQAGYHYAGN